MLFVSEPISTTRKQGKSILELLTRALHPPDQVRDKLYMLLLVTETLLFLNVPPPAWPKSIHSKRSIVNAILYVVKTGCQWSMLAYDLPPWQSVCDHYRRWKKRRIVERTFAFWLMPKMDR